MEQSPHVIPSLFIVTIKRFHLHLNLNISSASLKTNSCFNDWYIHRIPSISICNTFPFIGSNKSRIPKLLGKKEHPETHFFHTSPSFTSPLFCNSHSSAIISLNISPFSLSDWVCGYLKGEVNPSTCLLTYLRTVEQGIIEIEP